MMPMTMSTSGAGRRKRSASQAPPRTVAAMTSSPVAICTPPSCQVVSSSDGSVRTSGEEGAHRRDDAVLVVVGQLGRAGQREAAGEESVADRTADDLRVGERRL